MKKRIIVTGGAGFIGSNLIKALLERGYIVTVIDHTIDSNSLFAQENLRKKVIYKNIDIRDKRKITTAINKVKPSYIIHLAAEAIVEHSYQKPIYAFETNIMGTAYILEAARKIDSLEGVIVASSDKAYGKTKDTYTEESALRPDHPYDVSKASADMIAQSYARTYDFPVIITRFGNVYGEGDFHFGRIIPDICKAIIKKEKLLLRGDGSYVRDYIYVQDVVSGYEFLLNNFSILSGEAYNFSSNDTYSVIELINNIEKSLKISIKYKILNTAKNEIPYQHLDDNKIRNKGWKGTYSVNEVISDILEWYKNIV